ncbi:MAG: transglutaminase-like cysteine peptidase [Devosia sp.]|jgi:predicted transglutaminase-like cysteine proteinase|uniref:transglutaminase-like cysteine peptidase n=1 Tax=unclassified Devosia TaxID=196773 RepID=UPI0019DE0CF0|nr:MULTISPECIES: transglutaminase-like cysteine peptidase [unclassified Devosia]MBF0680210.1 transglutaminase-like cysteine peptidase [Devosia sp.]WEJ34917.1 transglutaminase-like cysteine peptidase [Devosia sp. SD17-2]
MAFNIKGLLATAIAGLGLMSSAPAALAMDFTNVAYVQVASGNTSIPVGHLEFCRARPGECQSNDQIVPAMSLTDANWQQLVSVNAHFNQTIVPATDRDLYQVEEFWTYPTSGYGDCEDYALAKRRALIEAGWHPSTLMIAVVRQQDGSGHAVLIARTDRGDLVLDNQESLIRVWNETPYKFLKRQSQANAGQWVDMLDDRIVAVAATQ